MESASVASSTVPFSSHDSFVTDAILFNFISQTDRYMEKMNGLLASVSKDLEFLVVHLEKIQCIHIVSPWSLEELTFQYSRLTRYCGNLVESGLEVPMTCYPKIATTSAMTSVKGLVSKSFQVGLIVLPMLVTLQ
ncbi:hypothetical protein Gotur_008713 [Gossypium turneri]